MKKETWVIVANSSHARIFKAAEERSLEELEALIHPESRLHTGDLISDNQGEAHESVGKGRHPMEPETQPKKQEAIIFAKQVLNHLESARNNGTFERFYIAASPSFLGLLRQELSSPLLGLLAGEVDKDITHMSAADIREYFPYVL